ncbi:chemotaxis protein CheR [Malaciobacter canalis]|uniref:protein-glutamate O-methyltransferase n=1 Tax=Malaciobacter canalis TaxID=1912871 RepID=A0ABX4LM89_9BACT|nr:protein-glutamate O-methyltransferase CheR [Malaciobacter canalis]PHO08967.1 chemotaxis protein CheR [Malaciobacter canalis]QEE32739.1 MCP protein methyltransferase [Malaciobacter canalis]
MINEKDYIKLTDVIYRRSGISIGEKRFNILKPKLEVYMNKQNYKTFREFFHAIRFDKTNEKMQDLLNIITINETYFFRENYQFEILINNVLYELDRIRAIDKPIRILCAPSSTGEEAYSIALHLLEEKYLVEKRDFEIVGIDIDSNVIKKAKSGTFSKRSVEFLPLKIKDEYFKENGLLYNINDFLKEVVDFKVINVMEKERMKSLGKFDVIFSRNMLIYFDEASRREVATTFYNMLNPDGFVFLGHAESMNRISSTFKTRKYGQNIVYQK